jgi:hypothetical protein
VHDIPASWLRHPFLTVAIASVLSAVFNTGLVALFVMFGKKMGWKRFQE